MTLRNHDLTPLERAEVYDASVIRFKNSSRVGANETQFRSVLASLNWNASEIDAEIRRVRSL